MRVVCVMVLCALLVGCAGAPKSDPVYLPLECVTDSCYADDEWHWLEGDLLAGEDMAGELLYDSGGLEVELLPFNHTFIY